MSLGAEFLRWEIATATAGLLLDDQPVRRAERPAGEGRHARRCSTSISSSKQLPLPEPHAQSSGARLTLSEAAQARLSGEPAASFLRVHRRDDYFGLLAFLPPDDAAFEPALQEFRMMAGIARPTAPRCSATARAICTPPASCTKAAPTTACSSSSPPKPTRISRSPTSRFVWGAGDGAGARRLSVARSRPDAARCS